MKSQKNFFSRKNTKQHREQKPVKKNVKRVSRTNQIDSYEKCVFSNVPEQKLPSFLQSEEVA